MSADEIFILLLVAACVAAVGAMSVHARRQKAAAPDEPSPEPAMEDAPPPAPAVAAPEATGKRRRKRR